MNPRKKLSDILRLNGAREHLSQLWETTAAAEERGPLPPGEYTFRILSGELFTSKQRSTPGYKLTLEVTEGEQEGRRAWVDFWLTGDALRYTKRDLLKLGVTDLEQLERPLPAGILIRGKLVLRRDDDGNERNRLVSFECAGIEPGDAFEPKDDGDDQGGAGSDPSFDFGANARPSEGTAPSGAAGGTLAESNGSPPKRQRKKRSTGASPATEGGSNP